MPHVSLRVMLVRCLAVLYVCVRWSAQHCSRGLLERQRLISGLLERLSAA